jgi:hypothetical protein
MIGLALVFAIAVPAAEPGNSDPNEVIRRGVLEYGDRYYDEEGHLVRRTDYLTPGRLSIAQHSPEYAVALLDTGTNVKRGNEIISAILDHQWLKEGERPWEKGNFIWWGDQQKPEDRNAVIFLTPWLCYMKLERDALLTDENRERLAAAFPLCLEAVRNHPVRDPSGSDNQYLLRVASLVMLSRVLDQPGLLSEAEAFVEQWLDHLADSGISEFNSPCYSAVCILALQWVYAYAPQDALTLREKVSRCLDFLYADIFLHWHLDAGIGAGTHSRAYSRDAAEGDSLAAYLLFKHCGAPLRGTIRCFEYGFAINDYAVPEQILSYGRASGRSPGWIRCSHRVQQTENWVERSTYLTTDYSLATQTGRRPTRNQDVLFKITYAGSEAKWRASYMFAHPSHHRSWLTSAVSIVAHQERNTAIVLYALDPKMLEEPGGMRLVIEPYDGGMLQGLLVDGEPFGAEPKGLTGGSQLVWQVGKAVVGLRLLNASGQTGESATALAPIGYQLHRVPEEGLVLRCQLADPASGDLPTECPSCGFVIHVHSLGTGESLAAFHDSVAAWSVEDGRSGSLREISAKINARSLRLVWDGGRNRVLARETDGSPVVEHPMYDSPLIRQQRGELPLIVAAEPR